MKTLLNGIVLVLLAVLAGCSNATPTYHKGTATMAHAYDTAYQNAAHQFDAQQTALIATYTQKKDVELAADLKSLAYQAQLNPILWTNTAVAAETTRLQAVHDTKIEEYKASLNQFRALKQKNEDVNLATAHKLRDALNPPALPTAAATVDLSAPIDASAGTPTVQPIFQAGK